MVSLLNSTRRGGHGEPSEQYQEGGGGGSW